MSNALSVSIFFGSIVKCTTRYYITFYYTNVVAILEEARYDIIGIDVPKIKR